MMPDLPTVEYPQLLSAPMDTNKLVRKDPDLIGYIRATRSIGVHLNYADDYRILPTIAELASEYDAGVAITTTPDQGFDRPDLLGDNKWWTEIDSYYYGCERVANVLRRKEIRIDAILADREAWSASYLLAKYGEEAVSLAEARHSLQYHIAKTCFPEVPVTQFMHGAITDDGDQRGATPADWMGDDLNVALYTPADPLRMLRRVRLNTGAHMLYVALGCSRDADGDWDGDDFANDYPLALSWVLGRGIRDYDDISRVVFWPAACDPNVPRWVDHYISFTRGLRGETP